MTTKGQVTVPRRIRQLLGLKPGETLVFRPVSKHMVQLTSGPVRSRLVGCLRDRIRPGLPPPLSK
ncbi:MAG: AbrB/MazE/SpoVT family DNA-binding domain-containing protein [Caldilineaceae bacterium]